MNYLHEFFSFFALPFLGLALDGGAGGGDGTPAGGAPAAGGAAAPAGGGSAAPVGGAPAAGTAAPAAAASTPLIGPDGNFVPGWAASLGVPNVRSDPNNKDELTPAAALEKKFTSPKALLGSYQSLEKMISAKGIIPPGPNATPEEKSAFYKALGRPDKPEDYGIKMPEKIGDKPFPKELWNEEQAAGFAKWAHERGFNKEQVSALIEFDAMRGMRDMETFTASSQKAQTEAVAALKQEWGADYAANLKLAQEAAKQAGGPELLAHPLANDPQFIKAMAKVGKMIVENPTAGARGSSHAAVSPAAEIASIMSDKKHAWQPDYAKHGHSPKDHADAVAHMAKLYALKNPS
jgi:hypothetical protein